MSSPTIAEVLDLRVIQDGDPEVLSDVGLDRPIRWVHVSDLADLTNLLQGGELVLTTGAALSREPRRYLSGLAAAGVVGVVVEWAMGGVSLPGEAAAAARECGLALVVLHRAIKFVQVTEGVHRRIVAAQYEEVAFARRVHEEFTHLTMQRALPAQIVTTTAGLLGMPVVLEDLLHQAVAASSPSPGRTAELLRDWERRSRLYAAPPPDLPELESDWTVQPVGRGEEQWARLVALGREAGADRVRMVLERAAQALSMHRMAERGQVDLVRQAQAGLIEDVLRQQVRTEKEALARAMALGVRASARYQPAAVTVGRWLEGLDLLTAQKRLSLVLDTLSRSVRAHGHTGLFSARPDGVVAMVLAARLGGRPEHEVVEELGRSMRRDVCHSLGLDGLVIGLGAARSTIIEAIDEVRAAAHVAVVAASMPVGEQVCFRPSDTRLRGLVAQLHDDVRAQRFAESELRELLLDDIATGAEGMTVLRGFLELAGNKTLLARRLHVSRPSLYGKLARIERVLGVDLEDGESRASLHVAVLILEAQTLQARNE